MGCDIHAYTEVRAGGAWHSYTHPRIDRSYGLFARMADVRNYDGVEPVAKPRGLPADASVLVRLEAGRWGDNAHSHSWLSLEEVRALVDDRGLWSDRVWSPFGYLFGNDWERESLIPGTEDARLVFWFDN